MEDKDLEKIEKSKEVIKKYIERLYNTSSVNAEGNITTELVKEVKKMDFVELSKLANEVDVFGKCVLHYRLPIDMRMNYEFSKATEVLESERKTYWKEYKEKLKGQHLNPEDEYNKLILMACTLHVPLNEDETESETVE